MRQIDRFMRHPVGNAWVTVSQSQLTMIALDTFALQLQVWRYGFWIRVFGVGVSVRRDSPSFSERQGYARVLCVGGWIVKLLGRSTS